MTRDLHLATPLAWVALVTLSFSLAGCASPRTSFVSGEPIVRQDHRGLAIQGYDPVAYFTRNEGVPGDPAIIAEHEGATYRFTSQAHRDAFQAEPERFVPAYGGWCAWAMADDHGSLVEIDPQSFLIENGRLLLFYDTWLADTRKMWLLRDRKELSERADQNWSRLTRTAAED